MNRKPMAELTAHFEYMHNKPPAPFNPDFDPKAKERDHKIYEAMLADGFDQHTPQDIRYAEYHKRKAELLKLEASV